VVFAFMVGRVRRRAGLVSFAMNVWFANVWFMCSFLHGQLVAVDAERA